MAEAAMEVPKINSHRSPSKILLIGDGRPAIIKALNRFMEKIVRDFCGNDGHHKVSNHELLYLETGLVIIRDGVRVENATPDASPLETIERLESENKELKVMVDSMKESIKCIKSEAESKWKLYEQCHELNLAQHDDFEKRLPQLHGRLNQIVEEKRELNGKLRTLESAIQELEGKLGSRRHVSLR